KEDLLRFQRLVKQTKPKRIVGLAAGKAHTRFETKAVNIFGRRGKVSPTGKASYPLYIVPGSTFARSGRSTTSFCNWTAYKISEFVRPKEIKASFLHFNGADVQEVVSLLKKLGIRG